MYVTSVYSAAYLSLYSLEACLHIVYFLESSLVWQTFHLNYFLNQEFFLCCVPYLGFLSISFFCLKYCLFFLSQSVECF